jgi:hypothetical protein
LTPIIGNKSKNRKMELYQNKSFCTAKEIIARVKKTTCGLEENICNPLYLIRG